MQENLLTEYLRLEYRHQDLHKSLELYVKASIKSWSGLKLKYLEQLAPVDLTGQDPNAVLEYNEENALYLMKNSTNFDSFISEQVTDLGNFSTSSSTK